MPSAHDLRLRQLLGELAPRLRPGVFAYAAAPGRTPVEGFLMRFSEEEGETLVVPVREGEGDTRVRLRLITLEVESRLDDVGLLAAVSAELAAAGIACNVISALHHDHLLVPEEQAAAALRLLQALQRRQGGGP